MDRVAIRNMMCLFFLVWAVGVGFSTEKSNAKKVDRVIKCEKVSLNKQYCVQWGTVERVR